MRIASLVERKSFWKRSSDSLREWASADSWPLGASGGIGSPGPILLPRAFISGPSELRTVRDSFDWKHLRSHEAEDRIRQRPMDLGAKYGSYPDPLQEVCGCKNWPTLPREGDGPE